MKELSTIGQYYLDYDNVKYLQTSYNMLYEYNILLYYVRWKQWKSKEKIILLLVLKYI
jgi:hypothetical protein